MVAETPPRQPVSEQWSPAVPTATPRAVFLGGSGQSGVSTLNRMLSLHPEVSTCPWETSFMVAAHGLIDVVRAVTTEYDPSRLDVILHEFDLLMHHHLCSPRSYPYGGLDLAAYFGAERYHAAVEQFFSDLGVIRYRGDGLTVGPGLRLGRLTWPSSLCRVPMPAWLARERGFLYRARPHSPESALTAARKLVDALFGATAIEAGRRVWCDQTSENQQFAGFLLQLYPLGLYINLIRDPLDVALAHQMQPWSPRDFELICRNLRWLYSRWLDSRTDLPADAYLEVRFEELTADPEASLRQVCQHIGIAYCAKMTSARPDAARLQREQERRRSADLNTYRHLLGPVAERLGYRVP